MNYLRKYFINVPKHCLLYKCNICALKLRKTMSRYNTTFLYQASNYLIKVNLNFLEIQCNNMLIKRRSASEYRNGSKE